MKKLLCFDLDGTLVDSTTALIFTFNEVFRKNGLSPISSEELKEAFGAPKDEIIKSFFPTISNRKLAQCLDDFSNILRKHFEKIKAIPGAESTLKKLYQKGYSLAVISNNKRQDIIDILEISGIGFEHFDAIIGADDAKAKPAPDEIFKAEQLTKKKAEFIIGDSIYDVRAGIKAGIKTISVVSGVDSIKNIWKEHPNIIIKNIIELDSML